jgi:RNA-directed DNA polymerase
MSGELLNTISLYTRFTKEMIQLRAQNPNHFYWIFKVPKKSGGFRTIYSPQKEMKIIQQFLLDFYLKKMPVSDFAMAYIKGRSISYNAIQHRRGIHFLHIDISNFFESMSSVTMEQTLKENIAFKDFSQQDFDLFISLLTVKGYDKSLIFPQGSVASPYLSNIYFYKMDKQIASLVKTLGPDSVYTRYSDDITISTSVYIDESFRTNIAKILENYGLTFNKKKTYFASSKKTIRITGLNVVDGKCYIGEKFKKLLKHDIYYFLNSKGNVSESKLRGQLSYLYSVEPKYYEYLFNKYCVTGDFAKQERFITIFTIKDKHLSQ